MKVIICGAGQVGFNIAHYLSVGGNDVTVVDQRPDLIRKISDTLDVRAIQGHASHPGVLEQAGAGDADMLIAVTYSDEVNMMACQVAHSLFEVPTKIARIREQSYLQPLWSSLFSQDHLPIDVVISPEIEVAKAIARRMKVPGALDVISLADDKVRLIGVRCNTDTPLINTPLRQLSVLFPTLNVVVVAIVRQGRPLVPTPEDQMLDGDEVYFVVDKEHEARALSAFGREGKEARRIIICGGGSVGLFLAQKLEQDHPSATIKIIESGKERAEYIAKTLSSTVVINGDALDPDILSEASVNAAETVVSVTNDDETNILSALLAKRSGAKRIMSLVNKTTYGPLVGTLGVDVVINPRSITVSNILQRVRRGRIHAVHSLFEGFGELIEADALETSPMVGRPLKDVKLPAGVLIGALVRKGEVITPRGTTVVQVGDRVVVFSINESVKKVEKMFSVQLEYF